MNVGLDNFYLLNSFTQIGIGANIGNGYFSSLIFDDNVFSLGVYSEVKVNLNNSFNIFTRVGYNRYFGVKEGTVCNDGTKFPSTGSDSCSWHGGIAYYDDYSMLDFSTGEISIGLEYNF